MLSPHNLVLNVWLLKLYIKFHFMNVCELRLIPLLAHLSQVATLLSMGERQINSDT